MSELPRLLLLLALAGAAMTFLGSAAIWMFDEERRIRRALTRVLKSPPEALLVAQGRGRGAGFSFASGLLAVAWDSGAWCLIYRLDELTGAELLVDGQVVGRVARGEPRRPIDQVTPAASQVTLRLVFDDPRHPEFALDLYLVGDEQRRNPVTPPDAIQEANRWLARAEAILRRPATPPGARPATAPQSPALARGELEPSQFVPVYRPLDNPLSAATPAPQPAAGPVTADEPPPWDEAPIPASLGPRPRKRGAEAEEDQDDLPF